MFVAVAVAEDGLAGNKPAMSSSVGFMCAFSHLLSSHMSHEVCVLQLIEDGMAGTKPGSSSVALADLVTELANTDQVS